MNEMDHGEWLEQHDRMMADHEIMLAEHHKTMARIDRRLDRAIRLGVQDARRQRKWNQEFDQKMTQIAAAQLVNEQLLKAFLERGGNGKH
jgi:hypothetical protein